MHYIYVQAFDKFRKQYSKLPPIDAYTLLPFIIKLVMFLFYICYI